MREEPALDASIADVPDATGLLDVRCHLDRDQPSVREGFQCEERGIPPNLVEAGLGEPAEVLPADFRLGVET